MLGMWPGTLWICRPAELWDFSSFSLSLSFKDKANETFQKVILFWQSGRGFPRWNCSDLFSANGCVSYDCFSAGDSFCFADVCRFSWPLFWFISIVWLKKTCCKPSWGSWRGAIFSTGISLRQPKSNQRSKIWKVKDKDFGKMRILGFPPLMFLCHPSSKILRVRYLDLSHFTFTITL